MPAPFLSSIPSFSFSESNPSGVAGNEYQQAGGGSYFTSGVNLGGKSSNLIWFAVIGIVLFFIFKK